MPIDDDAWQAPVPMGEPEDAKGPPGGPRLPRRGILGAVGAAVVVIVVVVVVLVTSGGGGGGGGSSGGTLSKSQWIQKADAICGRFFPPQAQDFSDHNLTGANELAQQALTEIRGLGLPTSGTGQIRKYEGEEQQVVNLLEAAVANSTSTNPGTAETDFVQGEALARTAATLAGQIGMHVCNSGQ